MDKNELYIIGKDFKLNRDKYKDLLNTKEPTWNDINKYYGSVFQNGECFRGYVKKRQAKDGSLKKLEVVKDDNIDRKLTEVQMQEINLKKERVKLQDQRTKLNELIRKTARYENLIDEFKDAMANCTLKDFNYIPHRIDVSNKSMVVCFSDFHYGYSFSSSFNKYNTDIFQDRFNNYISRIIEIGKQHNIGNVYVLGLGDYVSGEIHPNLANQNSIDVVKQTQEVSEYISNGLFILSKEFNSVHFYSVIGNHGRVHPSKEVNVYTNNFEKIIPWYIKSRLSNVDNITIHENTIDDGIGIIHINNQEIVFSHGENDSLSNIVSSLSLTLGTIMTDVFVGHKHHYQVDVINGINVIMSGSICGTDEYAKNLRKTGTACQTIAIYNNLGLECLYNVALS